MTNTTMRYLSDGSIELLDVEVPDPAAHEVQIAGGACGICSWDVATAKLRGSMKPPAPPGHEGVGYVTRLGSDVSGLKEGDRVAGGGFATMRNLPAAGVSKIPDSDLPDYCWIVEPVSCVVTGIDHCQIQPGARIAVIGCGFMGLMMLQVLLRSPLDALIAIDIVQSRLDMARQFGIAETFDTSRTDGGDLAETLKAREIDIVVDTSGAQAGLDLATAIVKRGGRINLFGWMKGESASFDPSGWHMGGYTIVNSSPSSRIRETTGPAIRLIDSGIVDLRPLVTHVAPLAEYPALMQQVLAGEQTYIKGVVTLDA